MLGSGAAAPRSGWLDRLFGPTQPPTDPPDGLPKLPGVKEPEGLYLLLAVIIGLVTAIMLEVIISASPVPPGGDPGQWIATTYPYLNRPYPSQVIFFGYPPLLFPLLGLLDVLGGGALGAGRLYVAVGCVLLGVATYYLGRSYLRRPMLALAVEGFVLFNPHLMELFFFGGYPTILGMVFSLLSLAFFARWLGSHRGSYLFLGWTGFAAAILTHSLVGILLVAALAFAAIVLLAQRALPREVLFSGAGAAGAGLFVFSVGGYYLGTKLAGVSHPNYFEQGTLGQKTTLNSVLYPFHLSSLPGIFGHHTIFTGAEAYGLAIAFILVLFFLVALLAFQRRLPVPVLLQVSVIMSVLAAGIAGWTLSIVTDYRRYAYFLWIPIALGVAWVFDYLLAIFLTVEEGDLEAPGLPPLPPRKARTGADPITVAVAVVTVGGLIALGAYTTVPTLRAYETEFTGPPHSESFLNAIASINHLGLPGSIVTDNIESDRWARALTDRDTYSPTLPNAYIFYNSQILDDERTLFALSYEYGVTGDSRTFVAVPGLTPAYFTASPIYGAWQGGVPHAILNLNPTTLVVHYSTSNNSSQPSNSSNLTRSVYQSSNAPALRFPVPGSPDMTISYDDSAASNGGFSLDILATPAASSHGINLTIVLSDTGSKNIARLTGGLTSFPGFGSLTPGSDPSKQYSWKSAGNAGAPPLLTTVSAGPNLTLSAAKNSSGYLSFVLQNHTLKPGGHLTAYLQFTTPAATNRIFDLPPILSTPDFLTEWSARYLLLDQYGAPYAAYYTTTYGARIIANFPPYWSAYTLPPNQPADPLGP